MASPWDIDSCVPCTELYHKPVNGYLSADFRAHARYLYRGPILSLSISPIQMEPGPWRAYIGILLFISTCTARAWCEHLADDFVIITGLIPETRAGQASDADDDDNRLSPTPRSSGQRSRSGSKPMRLLFNTDELTDGTRRSHVHVRSAVLRLHWNGHLPPRRCKSRLFSFSLRSKT